MIRTTPFHERLSELNGQGLYTHWQGHLSALRYSAAPKHEYFAVRNSVGVFDTSPLFKYRITGPDAERLLAGALVRDIRLCRPGRAHYTLWCDDRGFVMEDGVAFRHADDDFLLTAARPNLGWFADLGRRMRVHLEDVSDEFGMLAVQGPRSRTVLAGLAPEAESLPYFSHVDTKVGGVPVVLSRTGYTGDLGFELLVAADDALTLLDAVLAAGEGHGLRPFGEEALGILRIEAGLPLIDVDWHNSRTAWTDADRVTPAELGMGWMLGKGRAGLERPFVGRDAIRRELEQGTSRWRTVGVVVDWADWDRLHREAGVLPPKDEHVQPWESLLHEEPDEVVSTPSPSGSRLDHQGAAGYVTSFVYSPVLQQHIGLARVRPDLAAPGTVVRMEVSLQHATHTVAARTARLPHFDHERRTA